MKKIWAFLLLAVFVLSAATPAYAGHHRRHHRYHEGHPRPVIVIPF
jgi:fatty-acid desaturase